ncbi:MAG: precorrin-8X methylmutase [Methanothrix sp.]|jgi:precorrin-8X/cobalt-precorrin-8 methylmutase|uniref:precorrin-8X methylmutase n=1 Tax=Methanothrix sp. TaxID=90426 RepID=UPI0025E1DF41|nr:precorrin-8X methylmutase [Methanothrix sp.]MBK7385244.1 precorrin-8X methylmutase [Methanothrix sp.]
MDENYSDISATTREAMDISRRSRKIISEIVGNSTPEDRVRQRCAIATGDPNVAEILRFVKDPVNAGLKALDAKARIFVDINMVKEGVLKKGHQSSIRVMIGRGDELAESKGITRASAGVLAFKEELSESIVLIGNAPSALLTLCDLIVSGDVMPALVIGTPVGFVNAAISKEHLRCLDAPSISVVGTRGGTPIAVAAMNEMINMYNSS